MSDTEPTITELRRRAAELKIAGRSSMDASALADAIAAAEAAAAASTAETPAPSSSDDAPAPSEDTPADDDDVELTARGETILDAIADRVVKRLGGDVTARAEANTAEETVTAVRHGRAPAGGMRRVGHRVELDANADRAPRRQAYRDPEGRRKIVGAGQVIPAGYTLIEDASLAERVAKAQGVDVEDKATRGPRGD